jgi:hypothetical protein
LTLPEFTLPTAPGGALGLGTRPQAANSGSDSAAAVSSLLLVMKRRLVNEGISLPPRTIFSERV